jgi:hypothetical protein
MLDRATVNDVVMPRDYKANGIVHLSNWPSSTDGTGRAAGGTWNVQRKWDADTNRNIVMNFRPTLEEAYDNAKGRKRNFSNFHSGFDGAKDRVSDLMTREGKTDQHKLIARTVFYLFQMVATILW